MAVAASPALVARVADGLALVRTRIATAGGDVGAVRVVAVTKGFGADAIAAALANGLDDVGENYAQEAVAKLAALGPSAAARVHFIGRLQSNKIRMLAPVVTLWQTIDRAPLADALAQRVPGARVLVQVNVSDEPAKGGCAPDAAPALVERCRALGLSVEGLMTVGRTGAPDDARPGFARLRSLCDRMGLAVCSMGMTDDLEAAVAEGATMVRVGSALFGMRPSVTPPELP